MQAALTYQEVDVRPEVKDKLDGRGLAVIVNGEAQTVPAGTLAEALLVLGYGEQKVATAVNGQFVAVSRRAEVKLTAGDRLEIVAPRQGG